MQRAQKRQEWDALATEQVGLENWSEVGIMGSGEATTTNTQIEKMRTRKSLLIKGPPGADKIKNKA